jgi:hypothetical protein
MYLWVTLFQPLVIFEKGYVEDRLEVEDRFQLVLAFFIFKQF